VISLLDQLKNQVRLTCYSSLSWFDEKYGLHRCSIRSTKMMSRVVSVMIPFGPVKKSSVRLFEGDYLKPEIWVVLRNQYYFSKRDLRYGAAFYDIAALLVSQKWSGTVFEASVHIVQNFHTHSYFVRLGNLFGPLWVENWPYPDYQDQFQYCLQFKRLQKINDCQNSVLGSFVNSHAQLVQCSKRSALFLSINSAQPCGSSGYLIWIKAQSLLIITSEELLWQIHYSQNRHSKNIYRAKVSHIVISHPDYNIGYDTGGAGS